MNNCNTLTSDTIQALNAILNSIALEEKAISSIIGMEANKLRYAINLVSSQDNPQLEQIVAINQSIERLLSQVANIEDTLKNKANIAINALQPNLPIPPTPPKSPVTPPQKPCNCRHCRNKNQSTLCNCNRSNCQPSCSIPSTIFVSSPSIDCNESNIDNGSHCRNNNNNNCNNIHKSQFNRKNDYNDDNVVCITEFSTIIASILFANIFCKFKNI